MIRRLILLGVVLAGLTAGDVAIRHKAESEIEKRARIEAGAEASASASIKSFPFVGRLLASGTAGDISLTMHDVQGQSLKFTTVGITLANVKLDKSQMFKGKAELTHIDKGIITVGLSAADLSAQIHYPVTIANGQVTVTVAGRQFSVRPTTTSEGSVRLEATGLPVALTVPIPKTRLISCPPSRVQVKDGVLQASCDITEIPPALLKAASRVVNS